LLLARRVIVIDEMTASPVVLLEAAFADGIAMRLLGR
jgi:hypothetical protein